MPLLETSLQAAKGVGIPNNRIYILEMPKEFSGNKSVPFKTVGQLIAEGEKLPQLAKQKWEKGQGARQTAYLCYSSGTSGLPVSNAILGVYKMSMIMEDKPLTYFPTERSYDQPSQCNLKRAADRNFRKTCARCSTTTRKDGSSIRPLTTQPYLWIGCHCFIQQLSRRFSDHSPKV
jgi:hypothetical protein